MLRFASLGSGSEGNGLVIESDGCCVLVDCGFTLKETERRLARLGLAATDLAAILVTHEHGDHLNGVGVLARRHKTPVWMTHGTAAAERIGVVPSLHLLSSHEPITIGALEIQPFPVPHDAREPCQFVIGDGRRRLGLLTDAGSITPWMQKMLAGVDALIVECNHDSGLLAEGAYPPSLKARVGGDWGHLNNAQAAQLVRALPRETLQYVVAAHLSKENNRPEWVADSLGEVLDGYAATLSIACQDDGFTWITLD